MTRHQKPADSDRPLSRQFLNELLHNPRPATEYYTRYSSAYKYNCARALSGIAKYAMPLITPDRPCAVLVLEAHRNFTALGTPVETSTAWQAPGRPAKFIPMHKT